MHAEIITIGDELLIGQVVNTNQAYIAESLNSVGVDVVRMTTVGDNTAEILACFDAAWKRVGIVVVTGGLGPTHDDITKKAVCRFFGCELVPDAAVRAHIQTLYRGRSMAWSAAADEQAMVPSAAQVVHNPVGTAPGLLFRDGPKCFFVLPGVPYEMKAIVDGGIVPFLEKQVTGAVIRHLTLRTTGIAESLLARQIGPVEEFLRGATLAFLPSPTGVRLRVTVKGTGAAEVDREVGRIELFLRERAGKYVYGTGTEEIEEVLGRELTSRRLRLAVAESCTGGLIADRITNVSGSSAYFERGVVAYGNGTKVRDLGVPEEAIERYGAVSEEVAVAMAAGVRAGCDLGLSTTGIAGPTGGSESKPVGLVWIGYADAQESLAVRFQFGGPRRVIKERAAQAALDLLRKKLGL